MDGYRRAEWFEFRAQVIKLDGGVCVRCRRGTQDGVVLQVHHKYYVSGRRPWEYAFSDCETLCGGCHGREHGKVRPNHGWECLGFHDLDEPIGSCELCGTSIRYVFLVQHAQWGAMEVGEDCCDNLTCTTLASTHMESLRRFVDRRKRFVGSPRWTKVGARWAIRQRKIELEVRQDGEDFRLQMNGVIGKKTFPTLLDAKMAAFEVIESGKAAAYLKKQPKPRPRRPPAQSAGLPQFSRS